MSSALGGSIGYRREDGGGPAADPPLMVFERSNSVLSSFQGASGSFALNAVAAAAVPEIPSPPGSIRARLSLQLGQGGTGEVREEQVRSYPPAGFTFTPLHPALSPNSASLLIPH